MSTSDEALPDDHGFPMVTGLVEKLLSVDVTEVFSPPRVTVWADRMRLSPGLAFDLTQKGTRGWKSLGCQ